MIELNREVWEGWTVKDFITDLEPSIEVIMEDKGIIFKFTSKEELKKYCRENQPYYKKNIPEVIKYFSKKYNLT